MRSNRPGRVPAGAAWGLGAGALAGFAYLTREEGQVVVVAAVLFGVAGALHRRETARLRLTSAAATLAGFLLIAAPFMLYVGSTSARYGWGWALQRMLGESAALATPAGPGARVLATLAASPPAAAWMLLREFLTRAPMVTALFITGLVACRKRGDGVSPLFPDGYRVVLVVMSVNAAGIVVGASLQNGTVSLRYIQPLVLAMLPGAALLLDRMLSTRVQRKARRARGVALGIAGAIAAATLVGAVARCDDSKTGLRDAGVAIRDAAGDDSALLTTCPRISWYAAAATSVLSPAQVLGELKGGRASAYDFAAIEAKRFTGAELDAIGATLGGAGFVCGPGSTFPESPSERDGAKRILVYSKGASFTRR